MSSRRTLLQQVLAVPFAVGLGMPLAIAVGPASAVAVARPAAARPPVPRHHSTLIGLL